MKKTLIIVNSLLLIAAGIISGCDSTTKKVEEARADVKSSKVDVLVANEKLSQAITDSTSEFKQFKKESEEKIAAYEKKINSLKLEISKGELEKRELYKKTLSELERKNNSLKAELRSFNEDSKDKWDSFRDKFNKNMDELGQSISNFFSKRQ